MAASTSSTESSGATVTTVPSVSEPAVTAVGSFPSARAPTTMSRSVMIPTTAPSPSVTGREPT